MTTPNQQPASPFFRLPSELRHRIYEYYLSFTASDFADTVRPTHMYFDDATPHAPPLPSLMATCKRAYTELAPTVHSTAALRVHRPGARKERRVGFATHGPLRLERLRRMVLIIDLDYAYWNAWLDFFAAVTNRARALEHLVIDWAPRPSPRISTWEAKRDEGKERAFLDLLLGMESLKTVRFFGVVPPSWGRELRVLETRFSTAWLTGRWWREPGFSYYT